MRARAAVAMVLLVSSWGGVATAAEQIARAEELKRLSLEELVSIEVSTVSKKEEPLERAAAAVSVLTGEDLRKSGVHRLTDALRLVPGVHVADTNASRPALGIRGFTSRLSRSVLALIDGRSVYTPLFAGVFWENQDVLLEDVDRIEIIRGPGGTLWGANAVNGVINVITKSARDSQGTFVRVGGGSEERGYAATRYGGQLAPGAFYRIYAKAFTRDAGFRSDGAEFDDWQGGQAGFRSDWDLAANGGVTIQGDAYGISEGNRVSITEFEEPFVRLADDDSELRGGNLLGRWTRDVGAGALTVQTYYDFTRRDEANFFEERHTADLDIQHRVPLPGPHELVWGTNYRFSTDDTDGPPTIRFTPASRDVHLVSGFVQDEVWLLPDALRFTLGTKLEHNSFSGFEFQPNARLLWIPSERHSVWASVSRAVRTPSRIDEDAFLVVPPPPGSDVFPVVVGDPGFEPEIVISNEVGYRVRPSSWVFVDVATFYNEYDNLLSLEPGGAPFRRDGRTFLPLQIANGLTGETWGVEVVVSTEILENWRIDATYSFLQMELRTKPGSRDTSTRSAVGQSPQNQATLRSDLMLMRTVEVSGVLRYVDSLPDAGVGSYVEGDLRVGWNLRPGFSVAAIGRNLVEAHHTEFSPGGFASSEVQRSGFLELDWRF